MSHDTSGYVEGVPVKVCEKYRPSRRVVLPASCNYQINPELFIQEYDFVVEKQTLNWIEERDNRKKDDLDARKERIEKYETAKAEERARKEEERQKKIKEEEERLEKLREEEERLLKEQELAKEKELEEARLAAESKSNEEESTLATSQQPSLEDEEEDNATLPEDNNKNEGLDDDENAVSNVEDAACSNATSIPTTSTSVSVSNSTTETNSTSVQFQTLPQAYGLQHNPTYQVVTQPSSHSTMVPSSQYETFSNMLLPTQIPTSGNTHSNSSTKYSSINFAEFEGDANDPFNNAALKSINDMEELAQVLQPTTIEQKVDVSNVKDQKINGQVQYNNGLNQFAYFQQIAKHNVHPHSYNQFEDHLKTNVPPNHVSSVPSCNTTYNSSMNTPSSYYSPYYQVSQSWTSSYNSTEPNKPPPNHYSSCLYNLASKNPNTINTTSISNQLSSVSNSQQTNPNVPIPAPSTQPHINQLSQRPDLEDFYFKYYMNKGGSSNSNTASDSRSGEITPVFSSSSSSSLRSSRSVPDLTQSEDAEVSQLSQQYVDSSGYQGFSQTPPRPSSTGLTGLEDWKPLPELPDSPKVSSPQYYKSSTPSSYPNSPPKKSKLPDPFAELDPEAQNLVQGVAEMGFPRPMVARAVQKLGTNHKKLIEVLLILQNLQESGEDSYRTERAFYHYMGDLDKTKTYLVTLKQLLDLGFEEEKVIDLLLKHDNNRDRALEELIS